MSVLCHADNDFLWTSEGMSSQAQLNNLPTGYAAVDFAMTAIPWIVPQEKGADDAPSKEDTAKKSFRRQQENRSPAIP